MKRFLLAATLQLLVCTLGAQNIGINTASPTKLFSVNGSVMIDQNNTNPGTLDSAALLLGNNGAGIFSNKNSGITNYNGLDFWTNNARRLTISSGGFVGINLGTLAPAYALDVNGSIRAKSSLIANGSLSVDGNAIINGSTSVGTTLSVASSASVGTTLSVGGKGIVRSNSATNLRMGFTYGDFNITLPAGVQTDIAFVITPFSGDNNNIRVSICQFIPDADSGDNWGHITMTVFAVNPSNDQCTIRFFNGGSVTATMKGRLHLMSVATD